MTLSLDFWLINIVFLFTSTFSIKFFIGGLVLRRFIFGGDQPLSISMKKRKLPPEYSVYPGMKVYLGSEAIIWGLIYSLASGIIALVIILVEIEHSSLELGVNLFRFGCLSAIAIGIAIIWTKWEERFYHLKTLEHMIRKKKNKMKSKN